MKTPTHLQKINFYLDTLCNKITNRHPGAKVNRDATNFFAKTISEFGFKIEKQEFDCIDWKCGDVTLRTAEFEYEAFAGPYSLGCDLKSQLVCL